jgi:hypothetical protein
MLLEIKERRKTLVARYVGFRILYMLGTTAHLNCCLQTTLQWRHGQVALAPHRFLTTPHLHLVKHVLLVEVKVAAGLPEINLGHVRRVH